MQTKHTYKYQNLDEYLQYLDGDLSGLSKLDVKNLEELSRLIRERIINGISKIGGHLASSLGTIELTVALYSVLNPEEYLYVWDVGHQTYTHKILTSRNDQLESLGKKNGIAKFLRREESSFDHFGAGHASTSISAALGFLVGAELNKKNAKVVAVIGDGAMTGGLAFEAINFTGHLQKNLVVVLNDNDMSIDKNIGLLRRAAGAIQINRFYNYIRTKLVKMYSKRLLPTVFIKIMRRIDKSFMELLMPRQWFEALGFRYLGPVDGHNVDSIVEFLKVIKNLELDEPILLHVKTIKGKGYKFAEANSLGYHGVSPFEISSGKQFKKEVVGLAYTKIWSQGMANLLANDEKVVVISAAMLDSLGLGVLSQKYPNRVFDVGIAEANAVCFSAGLAACGIKPFVAIYSTFLQRAYDQLIHDVALQNLPVKFVLDRAGFVGPDGATHHGAFDLSYLRIIPNFVIMAPRNGKELINMLFTAYKYDKGPIAIRYPRGETVEYFEESEIPSIEDFSLLAIGKAEILKKVNGNFDSVGTIISIGNMSDYALTVSNKFAEKNVGVNVIDAKFVKPLDSDTILSLAKQSNWLVTLEENVCQGGFGNAVLQLLNDYKITVPVANLGIPDKFIEYGTVVEQREQAGLLPDQIFNSILKKFF